MTVTVLVSVSILIFHINDTCVSKCGGKGVGIEYG